MRQLLRLPRTLAAIFRIVREDCSPARADEHLRAFRGFHLDPQDPNYRVRPWMKTPIRDVHADQVVAIPVDELAFMMRVAMEIEDPILEYSHQNAEGFRQLLPALARFMGKNDAEATYAAAHGLPWCESPWCAEERRHGHLFARLIERLLGASPARDNPNRPRAVTSDEDEALEHLTSREAAEWSSSSTYVVMAAHTTGALHTLLRDVARDEIKHLCILSAAERYLLGPRPWARFIGLVHIGLEHYRGQRRQRSSGQRIGAHAMTAVEVVASHLLMEFHVRRWLRTVPLRTLATVFETGSDISEAEELSPPARARIESLLARGLASRRGLVRWGERARRAALEQQRFAEAHARELADIIDRNFGGSMQRGDLRVAPPNVIRRKTARYRPRILRECLRDAVRDYQIDRRRRSNTPASPVPISSSVAGSGVAAPNS